MRKVTTRIPETKKESNSSTHWIHSSKRRFVIDVVYLNDFVSTTHRYLITIVDNFSKYGWTKIAKHKTVNTILSPWSNSLSILDVQRYYSLTIEKN